MTALAAILALLSGIAAALVVCRAVHFPLPVDLLLGAASLFLMAEAAYLAGDRGWPLTAVLVGYLLAVLAMRRSGVKTAPLREAAKDWQ